LSESQAEAATIVVHSPVSTYAFELRSLQMNDELGRPFRIELDLQCDNFDVDFDQLLGKGLAVEMSVQGGGVRYFHGIIAQMEHVGAAARFAVYRVVLRPWLWLLTRTHDCRIYQDKSVPDIIKELFRDNGFTDFEDKLSGTFAPRTYCVQYRESDFNFVSRLMEEEGIYYHFKHEKTKHTLVLANARSAHATVVNYETVPYRAAGEEGIYEREVITEWRETREVETGTYVHTNFDFEKPRTSLEARSKLASKHDKADFEVFDYPGRHLEAKDGETYAKIRREELQVPYQRYAGKGNPRAIGVGNLFSLGDHPRQSLNKEYLAVAARHDLASAQHELGVQQQHPGYRFGSELDAIDSKRPFRPQWLSRKPLIRGPQTAMVVGPSGDEIYTDKYGRVKLKFHWDRYGKSDGKDSCWIRVSHAWAGKKWGQIYLPRIGQEVIVEFLEGDPDRPIVTGRVYNADQMPPYDLPANQTKSTLQTRSSTKGDDKTYNELRFEDKKDSEEVYFHAERDFNRVVENNDTLKVGFEKKSDGNQTIDIFNNQTITIGGTGANDGSQTLTILKDRTTTLKQGNDTLTIKTGNRTTNIDTGNDTLTLKTGNRTTTLKLGSDTLEAMQKITLKVGANKIVIEQAGITIEGITIKIKATATLEAGSPMTTVKGDGMLTLKGGIIMIN
jgi:type VI secretion system secreted protein VgrG